MTRSIGFLTESCRMLFKQRPLYITASSNSVQGELHAVDGIENQDSSFIFMEPNQNAYNGFTSNLWGSKPVASGIYAFGIFDGHGPQGAHASSLATQRMKDAVERRIRSSQRSSLVKIAMEAFEETACALNSSNFASDSGTTGSLVLIRDKDVVFANVGDSSAILVSRQGLFSKKRMRFMTPVHRASEESEANRIQAMGGFIKDGYVVDEAAKNGIGVTRTLGDRDMQQYGCSSEPEIRHLKLERRDTAIIMASDGLWDIPGLLLPEVVSVATRRKRINPKSICDSLLRIAKERQGPSDDCTILCVTLH